MALARATLTHLGTLERLQVLWNPETYSLQRGSRLAGVAPLGGGRDVPQGLAGGEERFRTELLLDATRPGGPRPDLRQWVETLRGWMEPGAPGTLPPRLVFSWGSFRFRGYLVSLEETWERFLEDGTPLRGWLALELVR